MGKFISSVIMFEIFLMFGIITSLIIMEKEGKKLTPKEGRLMAGIMVGIFILTFLLTVIVGHCNPLLVDHIRGNESYRQQIYLDPEDNSILIGYGHKLQYGMSKEVAEYQLYDDIADKQRKLRSVFPKFDTYSLGVQTALTDMMFCMDLGNKRCGFLSFTNMINYIYKEDWNNASKEMLDSKWAKKYKTRARKNARLMSGKTSLYEGMLK